MKEASSPSRFILRPRDQITVMLLLLGLAVFAAKNSPSEPRQASPLTEKHYDFLVDVNQADAAELMVLPGIGEKLSEAILLYRKENGPFQTAEELQEVRGVGQKRLEALRENLTFSK